MKPHPNGVDAERQALDYLLAQGLQAITTNYSTRFGEIDLVMQDKDTLVFVEVRKRSQARFGSALETIGSTKIQRLCRSAEWFLLDRSDAIYVTETPFRRFDVVAIDGRGQDESLRWIKNAF